MRLLWLEQRKSEMVSWFIGRWKNPGFELELALLAMGAYLFVAKADGFVDNFLKEKCQRRTNLNGANKMSFQLHPDTTLDVVHLYVSNVKKSLEFYTEVLSMKVLKKKKQSLHLGMKMMNHFLSLKKRKKLFRNKEEEQGYIITQFYYQVGRI